MWSRRAFPALGRFLLSAAAVVAFTAPAAPAGPGALPPGREKARRPAGEAPSAAPALAARKFDPSWSGALPTNLIAFDYDPALTSQQNGKSLAGVMQALRPGDGLVIGPGVYTIEPFFDLELSGRPEAPIWIMGRPGAPRPVLTRPDNSIHLGLYDVCEYLVLLRIEITGGDIAVRIHNGNNIWFDACDIHHCRENAISANTFPVEYLYFTRNEIHDTAGSGEGIYLGNHTGNPVARYCVIARNHVYNCSGKQGDGIEVKQGSYGNWIAENVVHDTKYPCIILYGTDGNPLNLVEGNVCWNSLDNTMQVQGEAIVRNNVLFSKRTAFHSHDHEGRTRDLTFVHNTIVSNVRGAYLVDWTGRSGMVFANNAVYANTGEAIRFAGGSTGVAMSGNVVYGPVSGVGQGYHSGNVFLGTRGPSESPPAYRPGNGLSDFEDVGWLAQRMNVTPSASSPLLGVSRARWAGRDFLGVRRFPPYEAGAIEIPAVRYDPPAGGAKGARWSCCAH